MERLTKIVATMGPGQSSKDEVAKLIRAGIDVARLNFSHGTHESHLQMASWVREAASDEGRVVAVLQDIQGPKLRVGTFPGGSLPLVDGGEISLFPGRLHSDDASVVYVDYEFLIEDVKAGEVILLADGLIRLRVTQVESDRLCAVVELGGVLGDGKGVAFPDTDLRVPAITPKDRIDLEFAQQLRPDYIAASFVRSGEEVREVRELAGGIPVISKIELAAAYANLDDILSESAGVMVARGDLGVQLPLEKIPMVQSDILRRTNAAGLISITATEMLESMTKSPRPTRAEVTDVANAVLAGTDAVMLSAETAVGDFPAETVRTMSRICVEVEEGLSNDRPVIDFIITQSSFASAVAGAAVDAAANLGIDTIVAFTESGNTAKLLSKYRPDARVIAFTPIPETLSRMALYRGVRPMSFDRRDYTDVMIAAAEKILEKEGICRRDEAVVMVAGIPPNQHASTNLMKLHVIGERDQGAMSKRNKRVSAEAGGY
jgi:pyruvate kinase